jgi:choline dehydrogenase
LSANPSVKVLLVERGQVNDSFLAGSALLTIPPVSLIPSKAIKTVPQKALLNKQDTIYESLSLGGRTRINASLYLPGCPAEYESWGKGWQWEDIAPIFARSEGRLELDNGRYTSPNQEGGEWKTRVVKGEYESSRQ